MIEQDECFATEDDECFSSDSYCPHDITGSKCDNDGCDAIIGQSNHPKDAFIFIADMRKSEVLELFYCSRQCAGEDMLRSEEH